MYKDNAVGYVVAEAGRYLVFGTTARLGDLSMSLRTDAHLNRLQGHRWQPIARSGKFVRRAYNYSRRALELMLSPIVHDVQR